MPFVMNASSVEQCVRVHGDWFTFKPKQVKEMQDSKVNFLISTCANEGFVGMPDEWADLEYRTSDAGKAAQAAAESIGIANRVKHLEWLKHNETVSLQRDIDRQNLKYNSRRELSEEALEKMKELAGYKTRSEDAAEKRQAEFEKIEKALEG
jgi:hypothetical protein